MAPVDDVPPSWYDTKRVPSKGAIVAVLSYRWPATSEGAASMYIANVWVHSILLLTILLLINMLMYVM